MELTKSIYHVCGSSTFTNLVPRATIRGRTPIVLIFVPAESCVIQISEIHTYVCKPCFPYTDSPQDPSRKVEDDTIIFTDVQTGTSAVYQCNVTNEYGYLLSNAFVNVLCKFITLWLGSIFIRTLLPFILIFRV